MSRKTIALIGGGQIGGNLALLAAQKELGNIIIFDIPKAEGMVKGKALDLMQLRPMMATMPILLVPQIGKMLKMLMSSLLLPGFPENRVWTGKIY